MFPTKKPLTERAFALALAFATASTAVKAQSVQPVRVTDEWSAGSTASYAELVDDAKAGHIPERLDLTQLRLKYAESPDYDPEAGSVEISEMYHKLDDKDYDAALRIANDVLAKQYVNIDAHFVAGRVYDVLSNTSDSKKAATFSDGAKLHQVIALGLIRSIFASAGDGKNPDCLYSYSVSCGTSMRTALKLISMQEEHGFARAAGLRPVKQSFVRNEGHSYDVVNFVNTNDNSPVTIYFDVTLPEQHAEQSRPR